MNRIAGSGVVIMMILLAALQMNAEEEKIAGGSKADSAHPLAELLKAANLTAEIINSVGMSQIAGDEEKHKAINWREANNGNALWNAMVSAATRTPSPEESAKSTKDGYYVAVGCSRMSRTENFHNVVRFYIRDNGEGWSVRLAREGDSILLTFVSAFKSRELAEIIKQLFDSPRALPAVKDKDGNLYVPGRRGGLR